MKFSCCLICLLWLLAGPVAGQKPTHFTIGANELQNAEVYSILETKAKDLFVATNQGLYRYHNGRMLQVEYSGEQLSTSLFNLIENSSGDVFCFNLNGQVFQLKNNRLRLFYTIPKAHLGLRSNMVFDEQDNLLIASKSCLLVSENGQKETVLWNKPDVTLYGLYKLPDQQIFLTARQFDTLYQVENGQLKTVDLIKKNNHYRQVFLINNTVFGLSTNGRITSLFSHDTPNLFVEDAFHFELAQFSANEIWLRSTKGQVVELRLTEDGLKAGTRFDDTFISNIFLGEDQTLYLGTFGKGLHVVRERASETYSINEVGNIVNYLAADANDNVYLADLVTGVVQLLQTPNPIYNNPKRINGNIFITEHFKANLVPENPHLIINKNLCRGALKDVFEVDSTTLLLATSAGLSKMGGETFFAALDWRRITTETCVHLTSINDRCQAVVYHRWNNAVYLATQNDLLKITEDAPQVILSYRGQPISSSDLLMKKDTIICATKRNGILFIHQDNVVDTLNQTHGLASNTINKLQLHQGKLYVWHNKGFQIVDLSTRLITTLGLAEGLANGSLRNFAVSNKNIWLLTPDKLISYPIHKLEPQEKSGTLSIDSVTTSIGRHDNPHTFRHNENSLKYHFTFKGIPFEAETEILYKMESFESSWNSTTPSANFVEYKYLPPGNYNLLIKTRYRDNESTPLHFPLTIHPPFWETGWFRGLLVVLVSLAIYGFFHFRLQAIKRRNNKAIEEEQLKANLLDTELKALRSQMNPHFIFNSLNSIQDLILQKSTEDSYDYIVLFSDLVRDILNYSNKKSIALEQECSFLDRYLRLEKLRFGDELHYQIQSEAPGMGLTIPPLIIQPFVENAIIHGLFHKEGLKQLNIQFFTKQTMLICIVEDNGIGRVAAEKIKTRQGKAHQSFALNAVKKRFDLMAKNTPNPFGYTITDLYDNDNQATGTRVEIVMPFP